MPTEMSSVPEMSSGASASVVKISGMFLENSVFRLRPVKN